MKDLTIYLNDHLAGSVGALEMLDGIIDAHEGKPLESFVKQLRKDISADQRELKRLMKQLGIAESGVRKVGAWVAEKLSRAKLRMGDSGKSNLALLQSLEAYPSGSRGSARFGGRSALSPNQTRVWMALILPASKNARSINSNAWKGKHRKLPSKFSARN